MFRLLMPLNFKRKLVQIFWQSFSIVINITKVWIYTLQIFEILKKLANVFLCLFLQIKYKILLMKKEKFEQNKTLLFLFFESFLEILNEFSLSSSFLAKICIFFSFSHTFSYLCSIYLRIPVSESANAVFKIIYFTNYINLIHYSDSSTLKLVIFILFQAVIIFTIAYLGFYWNLWHSKKSKNYLTKINMIVGGFCAIYNWIILIPALELFINVFDCNATHEILGKSDCDESTILYLFSIIGTIFSIILSGLILYIDRDFFFLDTCSLKINLNLNLILCFFIKIIMVIFFKYIHEYEWIYIVLLIFFCCLTYSFYFDQIPFKNEDFSIFFLSNIIYFSYLLIIFILWRIEILNDDDIIIFVSIFIIFSIKLGVKTYNYLLYNIIMKKSLYETKMITIMEEMIRLFYSKRLGDCSSFLLNGFFKSHYKNCKEAKCLHYKKILSQFNELDFTPQSQNFKRFINENLFIYARRIFSQKDEITIQQEISILKLITFLLFNGSNPIKTYYETLKILNQNIKFSFCFLTTSNYLKSQIKKRIKSILRDSVNESGSSNDKKINVNEFFSSYKLKRNLEKEMKILLIQKLEFFDKLKNGISGMDELYNMILGLSPKINNFKKRLDSMKKYQTSFFLMIRFKFSAIFDCVILNYLMKAIKSETEFFALMRESIQISNQRSFDLNFLSSNLIVCEASFLHSAGQLTEACKTGKLRNFFGYNSNAMLDKLNYLEELMPEFIRSHHFGFFSSYLNKEKEELRGKKIDIESFALTKEGFVFPMRTMIGYNLNLTNDFVLIGAIKNMASENYMNILCDYNGAIHNVSKDFFEIFRQEYDFLKINDFPLLNLFHFIPSLNQILEENLKEKKKKQMLVKNLNGTIIFPSRMKGLVEYMRNKKREETESNRYSHKSFSKQNLEDEAFFDGNNYSQNKKGKTPKSTIKTKQSKGFETINSNFSIKKAFFDEEDSHTYSSKFANISYDLIIRSHHYGQENNKLEYIAVVINKIWWSTMKSTKSTVNPIALDKSSYIDKSRESVISEASEILLDTFIAPIKLPENNEFQMRNIFEREFEPEVKKIVLCAPIDNNNTQKTKTKTSQRKSLLIEEKSSSKSEDQKISHSEPKNQNTHAEAFEKTNNDERAGSQLSSSRDSSKKVFLVYASISEIEKMNPWFLITSSYSILIQIIISLIYCIVFYIAILNYIKNYHGPTSDSMMQFCKQITNVGFGTMVSLELEYYYLGMISNDEKSIFIELLKEINRNSLENVRTINYEERDASANLEHQIFYKTLVIKVVDDQTLTMIDERFIDFVDQLVYKMNRNAKILDTGDFGTISYDTLINMQKNYVYFLEANSKLLNIFESNFLKYNEETSSLVQNYLIIFLLFYLFVKLFEFTQWLKYQSMIEKILMIFLRINSQEIIGVYHCTEQVLKILTDPSEKYFHVNIPEFYVDVNANKGLIESKSLEGAKKKNLNLTFRGFKNLSKVKIYLYFLSIGSIMIFYFFFNFYYWMQNNSHIRNLIELDSFFLKIYIYSTSTLCTNNLLIRQNIISNPSYEKIGDPLQTKVTRHAFLVNSLNLRMEVIQNVTANKLIQTAMEAKSKLNLPSFDKIINGDLCEVLRDENEFTLNLEGTALVCENLFNGGFRNGIANAENEYIRLLKSYKETYTADFDKSDLQKIAQQKEQIYDYLNNPHHMEVLIGDFFLSKALLIFYEYIGKYYNGLLDTDVEHLEEFLIISLCIVTVLNVLIIIYINSVIRNKYKKITLIISLIPFERLVNDEQTGYLIKKFLQE